MGLQSISRSHFLRTVSILENLKTAVTSQGIIVLPKKKRCDIFCSYIGAFFL